MLNNFMNNPFLDMFKQSFEGPMNTWSKNFNPMNWMENANKMAENLPWLKSYGYSHENDPREAFKFGEHVKGMEAFSELSHLALENTQAMLHRQAEIIQRHSAELYKTMQEMASSSNHADNMETHQDYLRSSFEAMVNDFKELAEMYSKASLETFDAAGCKMTEHMGCTFAKKHNAKHHAHHEHKAEHTAAHKPAKTTSAKKK